MDVDKREIHEESGIPGEAISFGPLVWFGECDLLLSGVPTRLKQQFIVATTKKTTLSLKHLTAYEKIVVKDIAWFSLKQIKNSKEIIYPVLLPQYLPDILAGQYPKEPIEIDLARQPERYSLHG